MVDARNRYLRTKDPDLVAQVFKLFKQHCADDVVAVAALEDAVRSAAHGFFVPLFLEGREPVTERSDEAIVAATGTGRSWLCSRDVFCDTLSGAFASPSERSAFFKAALADCMCKHGVRHDMYHRVGVCKELYELVVVNHGYDPATFPQLHAHLSEYAFPEQHAFVSACLEYAVGKLLRLLNVEVDRSFPTTDEPVGPAALPASIETVFPTTSALDDEPVNEDDTREDVCIACLDRIPTYTLRPCGHRVLCLRCARAVQLLHSGARFPCPNCQRPVKRFQKDFNLPAPRKRNETDRA